MLKAVFFDLDGTLLPMNEDEFTSLYFRLLCEKMAHYGYESQAFTKALWGGVGKMYHNNGSQTNATAFWRYFAGELGDKVLQDEPLFDAFYRNEFREVGRICQPNPYAVEAVRHAKAKGLKTVLSTNPLFPKSAVLTRMSFVGLQEDDFDWITTYDNSCWCKPNPQYFVALGKQLKLSPDEVVVFGNNDVEDYACAKGAGIDCCLVGDMLILHPDKQPPCPHIPLSQMTAYIDSLTE